LFCGAYRIVPGYAIVHPLGNPSLPPHREKEMRRKIVTAALESMEIEVTGSRVFDWK
jgi:glycine reductase complex component B subunit gamma